jgi:hypothetical protein
VGRCSLEVRQMLPKRQQEASYPQQEPKFLKKFRRQISRHRTHKKKKGKSRFSSLRIWCPGCRKPVLSLQCARITSGQAHTIQQCIEFAQGTPWFSLAEFSSHSGFLSQCPNFEPSYLSQILADSTRSCGEKQRSRPGLSDPVNSCQKAEILPVKKGGQKSVRSLFRHFVLGQ